MGEIQSPQVIVSDVDKLALPLRDIKTQDSPIMRELSDSNLEESHVERVKVKEFDPNQLTLPKSVTFDY